MSIASPAARFRVGLVLASAALAIIANRPASGSIVVDNTGNAAVGSINIFDTNPDENRQVGTKFTTGFGGPWVINQVTLTLSESLTPDRDPDPLTFEIRSDAAGAAPGATVFGLLTSDGNITATGNYTFSPTAPTILADSTSYWLVGIATGDDVDYQWFATNEPPNTAELEWSIQNQTSYSDDNGATWQTAEANAATMFAIDAEPQVDPGVVAEPATLIVWSLLGLTFGGTAWQRSRS